MTLYCPKCGYNLTGLPQNRCPECGQAFDPLVLARLNAGQPQITLGRVVWRLVWPPGAALALLYLGTLAGNGGIVFVVIGVLFMLIYGLLNAHDLAKKIAAQRALRKGRNPFGGQDAGFILFCTFGLFCCQWVFAAGGCTVCVLSQLTRSSFR